MRLILMEGNVKPPSIHLAQGPEDHKPVCEQNTNQRSYHLWLSGRDINVIINMSAICKG